MTGERFVKPKTDPLSNMRRDDQASALVDRVQHWRGIIDTVASDLRNAAIGWDVDAPELAREHSMMIASVERFSAFLGDVVFLAKAGTADRLSAAYQTAIDHQRERDRVLLRGIK